MKKTPRSATVMFDLVFFKFAIFYGTFSSIISYVKLFHMSKENALDSKWNSFQIKDSFEARGKQYWEKELTIH